MSLFTIRPSNTEKDIFRIKLTAASLLSLKLKPGDIVQLRLPNSDADLPKPAVAWENSGSGMKDTIVQTSKFLQDLYELKLGDRISITRSTDVLRDADVVVVRNVSAAISSDDYVPWQYNLSAIVPTKHDILAPGQKLSVEVGNKRGEFEIEDVGGILGRVTAATKFVFRDQRTMAQTKPSDGLILHFDGIGGLRHEIEKVKEQVESVFSGSHIRRHWSGFHGRYGLLLYGSKGSGKTLLIETLAQNSWGSIVRWAPGVKLPTAVFPRLVIADLSELTGPHKGVAELLTVFEEIRHTPTVIVGETRHPNNLNERLRGKQAFSFELELPVPDSDKRLDILYTLRRESSQPSDERITELAARTHGFVGADLADLLDEIWISAYTRVMSSIEQPTTKVVNGVTDGEDDGEDASKQISDSTNDQHLAPETQTPQSTNPEIIISQTDIDRSLAHARPSALQEVFLEKPNVRWTDIGGQHALKHRLIAAVNRTLSPILRARMAKLGLEVTKGVLLYGPPGCSKTLLAKALATEADLNFLAVKGAELISMYVGESERATREVFHKARAAAPSILFFDEIDAIASRGSSSQSSGSNNLNVLTTLLNEMDGFEELKNVIVIAATNKPEQIDPALLRPGRFDNVVYVGLPDVDTRREILENRFRNVEVTDEARGLFAEFAKRTEGYSGAEVVAICKAAGEFAFEAEREVVWAGDIEKAVMAAPRMVTREMLGEYERWNLARSAQGWGF